MPRKRLPYAERVTGAVRARKRQRDLERQAEGKLALKALNLLRAILLPKGSK